eukprot:2466189-Pleurochrysis_carterae.AAC.1
MLDILHAIGHSESRSEFTVSKFNDHDHAFCTHGRCSNVLYGAARLLRGHFSPTKPAAVGQSVRAQH